MLLSQSDTLLESTAADAVFPFTVIIFISLELLAMEENSPSDECNSSSLLESSSRWTALRSFTDGDIFLPLLELLDEARLIFRGSSSELEVLNGSDPFVSS